MSFGKQTMKVNIIGGLGNQLFQYATAYSYCKKNNKKLVVDVSEFTNYDVHPLRLDKLSINDEFNKNVKGYFEKIYYKILKKVSFLANVSGHYFEKGLRYDDLLLKNNKIINLTGYFQTEKYFSSYHDELCELLIPSETLNNYQNLIKEMINNSNSLSLHIRRGDYLSNPEAQKTHGICDINYFNRAVEYLLNNKIIDNNTKFFIFSDDIEWCKENISFKNEIIFVSGDSTSPEKDMYLMSLCDNNIISNSTFSWWGAWLNQNKEKTVIAPCQWFKEKSLDSSDIIPAGWIKL
ncbi:alpha-1,2-fucosyltransferase [Photobacterium leiognathi]|uniref:alpha-1,2-fucosyltransferase n=1 Tax=Photobacterium leiognathi TaxID=553611 RepID=UPI002739C3C8|nr:alpha-1,2-fucosyltransferase [Photobacterium leiognathi]